MHWLPTESLPEGLDASTLETMCKAMLQHGYPDFIWLHCEDGSPVCLQLEHYLVESSNQTVAHLRKAGKLKDG